MVLSSYSVSGVGGSFSDRSRSLLVHQNVGVAGSVSYFSTVRGQSSSKPRMKSHAELTSIYNKNKYLSRYMRQNAGLFRRSPVVGYAVPAGAYCVGVVM